jgi:hypothetical protein
LIPIAIEDPTVAIILSEVQTPNHSPEMGNELDPPLELLDEVETALLLDHDWSELKYRIRDGSGASKASRSDRERRNRDNLFRAETIEKLIVCGSPE